MTCFPKNNIGNVILDNIDLNNDEYKISKPIGDEKLKCSIQSSGLLDLPFLCKESKTYKIISGHNRLAILKELNYAGALCCIADFPDPDAFIDYALLKNYRNEVGPIGKCKYIRILKDKFSLNENETLAAAKNMRIPEDILFADNFEKVLSLPEALKKYLDIKDIGFKTIKNILRMSDEGAGLLSEWVIEAGIRVNIFKSIVDLVLDIDKTNKTNKNFSKLDGIDLTSGDILGNTARKDEVLYREIYRIRYPEYTEIKSQADIIINNLAKKNIEIDFPEFFEKDEIGILLKVTKRDNVEGLNKIIDGIDADNLKKLLDML
ncbi:MAG: hypothetical protein JXN64_00565 [Spirochaetes bacterium]|nr:hypothetical protein [Spirochaetota bacterium]